MPSSPDSGDAFGRVVIARRMTRSFDGSPVDGALVDRLVDWSRRGPSAGNSQSLHVLVLEGADVAAYWDTTLSADRRDGFPWPGLLRAPLLLLPWVEPARYVARYGEADKAHTGLGGATDDWPVPYWWVDGGAAVQNVLLGAQALGLGACFFGQFDHEPVVRARFGVPEGFRALGTIAVGWGDAGDRPSRSARRGRRPSDETLHRGTW